MLTVGPEARPWIPRDTGFVPIRNVTVLDLVNVTDTPWTDLDVTAQTHNLCTAVMVHMIVREPNGTVASYLWVGHSDDVTGGDDDAMSSQILVIGTIWTHQTGGPIFVNDSQQFRYSIGEVDNDSDMSARVIITGYWRWT